MPKLSDNQLACLRDAVKGELVVAKDGPHWYSFPVLWRGPSGKSYRWPTIQKLVGRDYLVGSVNAGPLTACPAGRAALAEMEKSDG